MRNYWLEKSQLKLMSDEQLIAYYGSCNPHYRWCDDRINVLNDELLLNLIRQEVVRRKMV